MDRHADARLLRDGNDRAQKHCEVVKQPLLVDIAIGGEQIAQPLFGIALIPAGQRQLARRRIHAQHRLLVIGERVGAVRLRVRKLAAQPVEHRHKVIADAFHARFTETADIFAVVLDQRGGFFAAELDVLGHGHALHDFELKTVGGGVIADGGDALAAPDAARGDVIDRGDDAGHARDLADPVKRDRIAGAVMAEGHFHRVGPPRQAL